MDMPADRAINARLLQNREWHIGSDSKDHSNFARSWARLNIVVSWIEHFDVLHLAWAVETNGVVLDIAPLVSKIAPRRVGFADSISEAGRISLDWISEVVSEVDKYLQSLSPCPIRLGKAWTEREWPKRQPLE